MTCNPRVSVVIIFLNEEKFLRQAAEDRTGADPPVCRPFEHALGAVCGLGRGWLIPLLGVLAAIAVREHGRQLYWRNSECHRSCTI